MNMVTHGSGYRWAFSVCVVVLTAGCQTPSQAIAPRPPHLPTYDQLVSRYNHNLHRIDRLWARSVVELRWRDSKGTHYEQGDGNLLLVLPDRVALSVGKLGHTVMWSGCDRQRFWLFDLRPNQERLLFVGRHARTDRSRLPLPVQPHQLSALLGLRPLQHAPPPQPVVIWDNGRYVMNTPDRQQRIWIDPQTARPTQIELVSNDGRHRVTCRLSRWAPMTLDGVAPGAFPWIATRIEMVLSGDQEEGTLTLFLSDPSDGRIENRIRDDVFKLDVLTNIFQPGRVIDLDEPSVSAPHR